MRVGANAAAALSWKTGLDAGVSRPRRGVAVPPAVSDTSLDSAEDAALVSAFQAGRREAFDVIVARHQRRVYQLCYRFAQNHEDAADLAQDVFVRAFKGLGRFKRESALGTWLYRIGVNVCLNRKAVRRMPVQPLDHVDQVADERIDDSVERIALGERREQLRAAIARLPPRQRATVILRVYQELTHEEIARVLDSSVGAVKANFFHALGNLRRMLQSC